MYGINIYYKKSHMHLSMTVILQKKSECFGEIINNRSHVPIFVLKEKDRKPEINKECSKLFEVNCVVVFFYKVLTNEIS